MFGEIQFMMMPAFDVSAVKTAEQTAKIANLEAPAQQPNQRLTTPSNLPNIRHSTKKKVSGHQGGIRIGDASPGEYIEQGQNLQSTRPKNLDLNKSPPREDDSHPTQIPILESSSLVYSSSLGFQEHPLDKGYTSEMIELSKLKKKRTSELKALRWNRIDPATRSALAKKWRHTRKKKLQDGPPSDLAEHRRKHNAAVRRYRVRKKAKQQDAPVEGPDK
ncbi:uncharacterized protein FA14DRAFT_154381 [Meira miltonrushii]|uniref:Uncharacterized protein n=1 Tax=Meira miltonrushii TaxID=1280837 RepID=A0A316VHG8_9BASI|nr:uncharacterized protein FA14DRAFT_154381 [Meira miltonrushii]PWN34945.1 hypothetical protein FA14DRAFT_154381 [Meira miltonrushii]